MDTFLSTFSFTLGIVAAVALLPFFLVLIMSGIPNLIMVLTVRFSSKEWRARKWKSALERGDESLIRFLRKHGVDKAV
jgi:uncharacterized membrane protein YoaK (UPF0700 family)